MSKLIMVSDKEATFVFQQAQGEAANAPAFETSKTFKGENNSTVTVNTVAELEDFLISSNKLLSYAKLAERPTDPIKGPIWDAVQKMIAAGQEKVLEITNSIRELTNLPEVDVPIETILNYDENPDNILDEATVSGAWAKSVSTPATGEEVVAAIESATAQGATEATEQPVAEPTEEPVVGEEQPVITAASEEAPASVEQDVPAQDAEMTDAPVTASKEPNPAVAMLEANANMFEQISTLSKAVSDLSKAAADQTKAVANALGEGVHQTLQISA